MGQKNRFLIVAGPLGSALALSFCAQSASAAFYESLPAYEICVSNTQKAFDDDPKKALIVYQQRPTERGLHVSFRQNISS
jgi:hypothetical protein